MYISDIKLKHAAAYAIGAAACAVIGLVYELFSHGVWSVFMVYSFAIPLLLGALPNFILKLTGAMDPDPAASDVYACGVITLTLGCILKGVLEIYGTTNAMLRWYWITGGVLTAAGAVIYLFLQRKKAD